MSTSIEPIRISDLMDGIYSGKISEDQAAGYFQVDEDSYDGLAPIMRLNPALVIDEPSLDTRSGLALNTANSIDRYFRNRRYRKKIRENPMAVRIVAEGDSWFQYPFILNEIIDYVSGQDRLAVLCHSAGGDELIDMAMQGEFYDSIDREEASYFLISGGGNDLVSRERGRNGIRDFLVLGANNNMLPKNCINQKFDAFLQQIHGHYKMIFDQTLSVRPSVQILYHGYTYPTPQPGKGHWLGKPMSKHGITDAGLQYEIVKLMLDGLNETLAALASGYPNNVRYIDLRTIHIPAHEWHDEFHPNSSSFQELARVFINQIP